jgi:hypothetical protein
MDQIPEEGVILVSATARTHLVTVYGMAYHMMHLQLANESLTRERAPLHPVAQHPSPRHSCRKRVSYCVSLLNMPSAL